MDNELYFIQDTRSYVGNAMSFWRPRAGGYTCDIDQAGQYSKEEAEQLVRSHSDRVAMWPVNAVKACSTRIMDMQYQYKLNGG